MTERVASPLAVLLGLEEQVRLAANAAELAFVMVNDTRHLVEYRQALLFADEDGLVLVSGIDAVERSSPFAHWAERIWRRIDPKQVMLAGATALDGPDAAEWADWLPPQALWLPLADRAGDRCGALLLVREREWSDDELTLAMRAAAMYGAAWADRRRPALLKRARATLRRMPRLRLALAALALLALAAPVRLSVLAPAEIVASKPAIVRAPLDGVIDQVHIQPNQTVAAGALLATLDRTTIDGRAEVARKALSTARAELDQVTQQSFFDPKAKSQVAVIRARIDERAAELAQLDDLAERSRILSPRAGTIILDDPSEWLGRPVAVGERILSVADPAEIEVEAWLPPYDMIALNPGDPVTMFPNADPLSPLSASLGTVTYEAILRPDGQVAHRVRAHLAAGQSARLGHKGTARLDGERVPLIYWLIRRPLAAIRSTLGF